jgi:hypothetical protein
VRRDLAACGREDRSGGLGSRLLAHPGHVSSSVVADSLP